ncbi:MAG: hypothetical protein ACLQIB_46425 [Isosphaeraceae bacterium]
MPTNRPTKPDPENSLPRRPGSGPKPEFDEQLLRSQPLRPRADGPLKPEIDPEEAQDPSQRWIEAVQEYQRRLRGQDADR